MTARTKWKSPTENWVATVGLPRAAILANVALFSDSLMQKAGRRLGQAYAYGLGLPIAKGGPVSPAER